MKIFKAIIYAFFLLLWAVSTITLIIPFVVNGITDESWSMYGETLFNEFKNL